MLFPRQIIKFTFAQHNSHETSVANDENIEIRWQYKIESSCSALELEHQYIHTTIECDSGLTMNAEYISIIIYFFFCILEYHMEWYGSRRIYRCSCLCR